MYSVYRLLDPRDMLPYYVGISKNPQQRFQDHLRKDNNWLKSSWIQDLKELGLTPVFEIIAEKQTCREAQELELQLIRGYHESGMTLTNLDGIKRKSTSRGMIGSTERQRWSSPVRELQIRSIQIVGKNIEELLTHEDVARILRISEYTARGLCKSGQIKSRKVGRNYRVKQEDLRKYIDNPPEEDQNKK